MKIYCSVCMKSVDETELDKHSLCGIEQQHIEPVRDAVEEIAEKSTSEEDFERSQLKREKKREFRDRLEKELVESLEGKNEELFDLEGELLIDKFVDAITPTLHKNFILTPRFEGNIKSTLKDVEKDKINWRILWSSIVEYMTCNYEEKVK